MSEGFPIFKRPVTKTSQACTPRSDVDVNEAPRPKSRKQQDLPTRNDVSDLCDLAAAVFHTDKPYIKNGKLRQPNRGRVYNLVTRVRAKLEGLP